MQRPEPRRIQFISIAHPEQSASANRKQRKEAYSHASRAGHARIRLLRTKQYQDAKQQHSAATEEGGQRHMGYSLLSDMKDSESLKPAAQLQLGSPVGHLPPGRRDPFDSMAFSFQSVDHMLLDHYVTTVIPYLKTHCKKLQVSSSYVDAMIMNWVKLALTSEGFLSSLLLTSSRHLSYCYRHNSSTEHVFSQLAIRHKLTCIQNISGRIAIVGEDTTFSDSIVAQVIVLAFDEISQGNMLMAKNHMGGVSRMILLNGGIQTLGLGGFLGLLFEKFLSELGMYPEPSSPDNLPPCSSSFGLLK